MRDSYILKNRVVVRAASMEEWSAFFSSDERVVAKTTCQQDGIWVSTVFLGIDHRFGAAGPPLLFETMAFPNDGTMEDLDCGRYSTWDEAESGHWEMVEKFGGEVNKAELEERELFPVDLGRFEKID